MLGRTRDELAVDCKISAEKVLPEMALLDFANMLDYMRVGKNARNMSLSDLSLTGQKQTPVIIQNG